MDTFFTFIRRHLAASLIGTIGLVFLVLGYADQANAVATQFEPWQLQALGAAMFIVFVVMVLVSYDAAHLERSGDPGETSPIASKPFNISGALSVGNTPEQPAAEKKEIRLADMVPAAVAAKFEELKLSDPTRLQEKKFLAQYVGKWIELEMGLYQIKDTPDGLEAFLYFVTSEGLEKGYIDVTFDSEWEQHLETASRGDNLRFRALIVEDGRWIEFRHAQLLEVIAPNTTDDAQPEQPGPPEAARDPEIYRNSQWVVGEDWMGPVETLPPYDIELSRIGELTKRGNNTYYDWPIHMAAKTWVDVPAFNEAFERAIRHFAAKSELEVDDAMMEASFFEAYCVAAQRE